MGTLADVEAREEQRLADELAEEQQRAAAAAAALAPYEIDPRDVLVGERLAVGGFAEVFVGRYQVGGVEVWGAGAGGMRGAAAVRERCLQWSGNWLPLGLPGSTLAPTGPITGPATYQPAHPCCPRPTE